MHQTLLLPNAGDGIDSHDCFFRSVISQLLDVVTVADVAGTILYISPSVERLLGRPPGERIGQSVFEFVHPEEVDRAKAAFDEALRTGEPAGPVEYRCRHRDGDYRTLETIAGRCVDDSGVMVVIIQSRDTTDRTRRSRGRIPPESQVASSRDFNNLLVVLARQMSVLESARSATVYGDALEMRAAIDRARFLVNQLLAVASLDEERSAQSADVNRVLEEMAPDLERVSGPGIEVVYLLGATTPHAAIARTSLERVLLSFVAYIRNRMPSGGRLTVSTRNPPVPRPAEASAVSRRPDHVLIELTAARTAAGPVQIREIESAFSAQGTEPGVHTAYTIVRKAGGRIAVDSENPGGTTLRVHLPVAAV